MTSRTIRQGSYRNAEFSIAQAMGTHEVYVYSPYIQDSCGCPVLYTANSTEEAESWIEQVRSGSITLFTGRRR